MSKGRIVESESYEALMEKQGRYNELYEKGELMIHNNTLNTIVF